MEYTTDNLTETERKYLATVLIDCKMLSLENMWALVDAAWDECQCDQNVMDERVTKFYKHPVWLLNGMFVEQHAESLRQRHVFTEYISRLKPRRIADFGGGYGSLARMIGVRCPTAVVHVVEPYPHIEAVSLASKTPNVCYVPDLIGEYDIIIATDVFEHVLDPLSLVETTSMHLKIGGEYIIANCFWPVVRCHLPSLFHFRWSWDLAMLAMNLAPGIPVSYGRTYKRTGAVSVSAARRIESCSKRWFRMIELMPDRARERVAHLLISGCKSLFLESYKKSSDF